MLGFSSLSEMALDEIPDRAAIAHAKYGRVYSEPTDRGAVLMAATHNGAFYASPFQGPNKP